MSNLVVTIAREYGSGGRTVGEMLAKKLGIGFVGVPAQTSRLSQLINHAMREVAGVWHFYIFGR